MNTKTALRLLVLALLAFPLIACGGGDDRLDSLDSKFYEIKAGMTMDEVVKLVGEPESTEPLEDSGGGMISTWPDKTRVLYDGRKQVTGVIHNGAPLDLE